jgi:LexA DNA binding domain
MKTRAPSAESLTRHLKDLRVSHILAEGKQRLRIHFSGGTVLLVEGGADGLLATVEDVNSVSATQDVTPRPTKRQFEYLAFIAKYTQRFGRAPAESDIERHFLVSAPSVNQMMQTLERRGFIARQPGVPRSARICIDLAALGLFGE